MKKFYYFYIPYSKGLLFNGRYIPEILADDEGNIYEMERKKFIAQDVKVLEKLREAVKVQVEVYYDEEWNIDVNNITCPRCGEKMDGIISIRTILEEYYYDFEKKEGWQVDEYEQDWSYERIYVCSNCRDEIPYGLWKDIEKQLPEDWE